MGNDQCAASSAAGISGIPQVVSRNYAASGEQDQIVAVHQLALVAVTKLAHQVTRGAPQQLRNLVGVVVDEAPSKSAAGVVDEVDRLPRDEGPAHVGDPGR